MEISLGIVIGFFASIPAGVLVGIWWASMIWQKEADVRSTGAIPLHAALMALREVISKLPGEVVNDSTAFKEEEGKRKSERQVQVNLWMERPEPRYSKRSESPVRTRTGACSNRSLEPPVEVSDGYREG